MPKNNFLRNLFPLRVISSIIIYIENQDASHITFQGQVSNETHIRPSESARINWIKNYAIQIDPTQGSQWRELLTFTSEGLVVPGIQRARSKVVRWKTPPSILIKQFHNSIFVVGTNYLPTAPHELAWPYICTSPCLFCPFSNIKFDSDWRLSTIRQTSTTCGSLGRGFGIQQLCGWKKIGVEKFNVHCSPGYLGRAGEEEDSVWEKDSWTDDKNYKTGERKLGSRRSARRHGRCVTL